MRGSSEEQMLGRRLTQVPRERSVYLIGTTARLVHQSYLTLLSGQRSLTFDLEDYHHWLPDSGYVHTRPSWFSFQTSTQRDEEVYNFTQDRNNECSKFLNHKSDRQPFKLVFLLNIEVYMYCSCKAHNFE